MNEKHHTTSSKTERKCGLCGFNAAAIPVALRSNQMFYSDTCVNEHELSDSVDMGAPPTAPRSEILVEFLPADALELGLNGTTMPMERLLYLLDGNVLEEDQKMAELVDRISYRYGAEYDN